MNLNNLYTQVNMKCVVKKQPPVTYADFFVVLLTLESKGLVKLTDDSALVDANLTRMINKMKEG